MDITELAAREGIRDLVARYNSLGDRGRSAEVAALFAPDGVLEFEAAGEASRSVGPDEIASRLEEFKADFAARLNARTRLFHSVSTHVIDFADDSHATGRAYVTVLSDQGLFEWGQYVDAYVRRPEGWRFAGRTARRFGIVS